MNKDLTGGSFVGELVVFRRCGLMLATIVFGSAFGVADVLDLGQRRELFVDALLIDRKTGVDFVLHEPRDEGPVLSFDAPWEGPFCAYVTVLRDGDRFKAYYRGKSRVARDGIDEVTCVAESQDARTWTKPKLNFLEVDGTRENNVILAEPEFCHNFSPFLDSNPATPSDQRFKAVAGTQKSGLRAYVSADGLRWRPLHEKPFFTKENVPAFGHTVFDSQNVAFWSVPENRYLLFFRVYKDGKRRVARAESKDFLKWDNIQVMEYRRADGQPAPIEELYTSQTHAYFRAPHLYVATPARFFPGRQVLTADEAKGIGVHPSYFKDVSDAAFMTSRGGNFYERTIMGAFIRPGIGAENWVSRTTYPALHAVQTGPAEMSVFVNQNYAQPTAHLRRYSLRLDGFMSLRAPYEGGELVTRPLRFTGRQLLLNFATSAAGGVRVGILEPDGKPIAGRGLGENVELIGNDIERAARWKDGSDISALAGKPVRLHIVMKDADLYAMRFAD